MSVQVVILFYTTNICLNQCLLSINNGGLTFTLLDSWNVENTYVLLYSLYKLNTIDVMIVCIKWFYWHLEMISWTFNNLLDVCPDSILILYVALKSENGHNIAETIFF